MAEDIDQAHAWFEDWWGADTDSRVYEGAEGLTGVATALAGGLGLGRAAVGGVLRGATRPAAATAAADAAPATSATSARSLHAQLSAQQIAGGHAFKKHVLDQQEFPGVTTREEFARKVEEVITHGEMRPLSNGRTGWWHGDTVVFRDPSRADGGTAYKPTQGKADFLKAK